MGVVTSNATEERIVVRILWVETTVGMEKKQGLSSRKSTMPKSKVRAVGKEEKETIRAGSGRRRRRRC